MMKNNKIIVDERQQQIKLKAFSAMGIFLFLSTAVIGLYKLHKTGSLTIEFWLLLLSYIILCFTEYYLGNIYPPQDEEGNFLPLTSSKEDFSIRNQYYFKRSIKFSIVFTILDTLIFNAMNIQLTSSFITDILISVLLGFCIAYILNLIFAEIHVKKYNALLKKMDSHDTDE